MLLYSKPTQYALRALSYIIVNSSDGPCTAEQISMEEDIPKPFLSKILKQLVDKGILTSVKGPNGGFTFTRNPHDIALYDIVGVFDNIEAKLTDCAIGWKECDDANPCKLHESYKKLRESIKTYLFKVDLALFVESSGRKKKARQI